MTSVDGFIAGFDRALRALSGISTPGRASPAATVAEADLQPSERGHAAALMRVNHAGEICAQALYQGQALTARNASTRDSLAHAAREEEDHLVWSAQRIQELGGHTSVLNPLWYLGSLGLGAAAGMLGDRWSLAFLAETERQVEAHLTGHLDRLPEHDRRTRAVVEAMRADEAEHRQTAIGLGAAELPEPVRRAMRAASRVMTGLSQHL